MSEDKDSERKYPGVKLLSILLKRYAYVSFVIMVLVAVISLIRFYKNGEGSPETGFILIGCAAFNSIVTYGIGELLILLISIETNTRNNAVVFSDDITCPYCGTEYELEPKELFSQKFICNECKKIIEFSEYYAKELENSSRSNPEMI